LKFEADQLDGRGFVSAAGKYSTLFTSLPRMKATGGVAWHLAPFTANLNVSYVGGYTDPPIEGVVRAARTVDAVTMVDLSGTYDLETQWSGIRRTSVTLGVDNVLDELPPFILARNDFDRGQHDILGRYVYGAINFSF
jgi:outer membrane receptor protein involved in Fe transport